MAPTDDSASIHAALDGLMMDLHRRTSSRPQAGAALGVVWRAAAGEYVARHAKPLGLNRGMLRLVVSSTSLREELLRLEPELVCKLNRTGRLQVTSLVIEVSPNFERLHGRRLEMPDEPPVALTEAGEPPAEAASSQAHAALSGVREELRPTFQRLLALHREHQQRRG